MIREIGCWIGFDQVRCDTMPRFYRQTTSMKHVCWRPSSVTFIFSKCSEPLQQHCPYTFSWISPLYRFLPFSSRCWWYCFTPSSMKDITKMRIEMLGTAFTTQHSDARVLEKYAVLQCINATLVEPTRRSVRLTQHPHFIRTTDWFPNGLIREH